MPTQSQRDFIILHPNEPEALLLNDVGELLLKHGDPVAVTVGNCAITLAIAMCIHDRPGGRRILETFRSALMEAAEILESSNFYDPDPPEPPPETGEKEEP